MIRSVLSPIPRRDNVRQIVLEKSNIGKLITALLSDSAVFGPVRGSRGVELRELSEKSSIEFEFGNFNLPLKRMFFPQCEVIARWDAAGMTDASRSNERTVVFGVRPCDTQSIAMLDKVFIDDRYVDPFYRQRRDSSLIISLACSDPASTCFCTSTSGGPAATRGADIIAFSMSNALLFEPVTDKGRAALEANRTLLREPTEAECAIRDRMQSEAEAKINTYPVAKAVERLHGDVDAAIWETAAQPCMSCGACALLCPTCHCFDFHDETGKDGGIRVRVHDTCQFESFTREASGHNPRGATGLRTKQRMMHKFSYTPDIFGEVFCVGCGRCICNCPGGGDIRETINKVTS